MKKMMNISRLEPYLHKYYIGTINNNNTYVVCWTLPILSSPLLRSVETKALSIVWCLRINWGQTPPTSHLPPLPPQIRATQRQLTTGVGGGELELSIFMWYHSVIMVMENIFRLKFLKPSNGLFHSRQTDKYKYTRPETRDNPTNPTGFRE